MFFFQIQTELMGKKRKPKPQNSESERSDSGKSNGSVAAVHQSPSNTTNQKRVGFVSKIADRFINRNKG